MEYRDRQSNTPSFHHSSYAGDHGSHRARQESSTTGDEPSEIERLKEELRREHDMYLRALADFDNYRRRVERERATRGPQRQARGHTAAA